MRIDYTKVWRVNGKLIVAHEVEDAVATYKKYCDDFDMGDDIEKIEVVCGSEMNDTIAITDEDYYKKQQR